MIKSEVLGSAITALHEQVNAIEKMVRGLEQAVGQPAPAPEVATLPSGWAIIRQIIPIPGCQEVQEIFGATVGFMTILAVGHASYKEDIARCVSWFESEQDAQQAADLLNLRDVQVARLYRDTLGEVK